jgi:hypothetical protein
MNFVDGTESNSPEYTARLAVLLRRLPDAARRGIIKMMRSLSSSSCCPKEISQFEAQIGESAPLKIIESMQLHPWIRRDRRMALMRYK